MPQLSNQQCAPCTGNTPPLEGKELEALLQQLDAEWRLIEEHHLEKDYPFDSYLEAIDFVNTIAHIALDQGHHPDILLSYGNVKVMVWTHKIGGLSINDFIIAARVEDAFQAAPIPT